MAALGGTTLTLADIAKSEPAGILSRMAYVLEQRTPLCRMLSMVASNKTTSHVSSIQTGEPTVTLRKINAGVSSSIGTTEQVEDVMTMMEIQSTTDTKLLELSDNPQEIRMSQGRMAQSALAKKCEELLWYGDPGSDANEFYGLTFREHFANLGDHCLDASAAGADNCSMWLINIDVNAIHCIYPKNTVGGLRHKDWGPQLIQLDDDLGGGKLAATVDQWMWDIGLVMLDPRQICRVANIDISEVLSQTGDQEPTDYLTNILWLATKAQHHIYAPDMGTAAWFMPRDLALGYALMAQTKTVANSVTFEQTAGQGPMRMRINGIPVHICDQLVYDEDLVT